MSRFRGRENQRFRAGGGSAGEIAAAQLLQLIANDNGTALIWDYAKTDRRFANPDGGANPAIAGDVIGLDLDSSKWGGKSLAEVLAAQPELWLGAAASNGGGWVYADGVWTKTATSFNYLAQTGLSSGNFRVKFTVVGSINVFSRDIAGAVVTVGTFSSGSHEPIIQMLNGSNTIDIWFDANSAGAQLTNISVKEIPGNHARQGTGASKPKWQPGPKPFALYDGVDDYQTDQIFANNAGTMVSAFRVDADITTTSCVLAAGTPTGNKFLRIQVLTDGRPQFAFNDVFPTPVIDVRGIDVVAVQTWGGGQRRCYLSTSETALTNEARVSNHDGSGAPYQIGTQESATGLWFKGRIYGTLIRSVLTSDADVRNIILPAFKGLYS